ncbi:hypothetical protein CFII64_21195 [Pseudomonas sp. CFII64]|nr:hypothetical protein CFII64_21195 [Pseudomonas sp. CFII64]
MGHDRTEKATRIRAVNGPWAISQASILQGPFFEGAGF